jgi:hypothetical protein
MRSRGPGGHEPAARAGERDRLGRDGRPVIGGGAAAAAAPVAAGALRGRVACGGAQQRGGGGAAHAEQTEPPDGVASRDDPVRVVLGDLLGQVALQLGHRLLLRWKRRVLGLV